MPYKIAGPHNTKQRALDFTLYDISAGINIQAAPQEIADNELTDGTNGYLDVDGGFYGRLGVTRRNVTPFSSLPVLGLIRFFQTVIAGVPQATFKTFTLAQSGGTLFDVDRGISYGGAGALGIAGQAWQAVQVYDPNRNGGTDVLVICTGSGGPYIFDGTVIYTPANWTANIAGAKFVLLMNGILWFSGIPSQPNTVWGSQLLAPENIPFYNLINVSRTVMGLGAIGAGAQGAVCALMNQGNTLIVGTGPQNFDTIELPDEEGCMAYRSPISVDGILYYVGETAIKRCDGYSIQSISDKVRPWILNDPNHQEFPMNGNRALSWSAYWNQRIYFFYDSGNVGFCNVALVYDLTRRGFTIYQGVPFMSGGLLNAPFDPNPSSLMAGSSTTGIVYNVEASTPVVGLPQNQWPTSDDGAPIFVRAQTKYFKIGNPGSPKTLLRAYPEVFGTVGNPGFGVATNYSAGTQYSNIPITASSTMTWGSSVWGPPTRWNTPGLQFVNPRIDYNIQGEAMAFSMLSNDTNPPWKWVGLTGVFSQLGKS